VCLLHVDKSKIYTSSTEYIEETRIHKDCAVEDPLYCQRRESSKALHLGCEVSEDLCFLSEVTEIGRVAAQPPSDWLVCYCCLIKQFP